MNSRWLTAFFESGGDAPVVTLLSCAENAKIAKNARYEQAAPHFGNYGNFDTSSEKQNTALKAKADNTHWTVADWQEFYNERAGVAEYDGSQPRDEAERMAYESCITRWLDIHPSTSASPHICPHCQRPSGAPDTSSVPVYSGQWLHHACLDPWLAVRRQEAIKSLAKMEIV